MKNPINNNPLCDLHYEDRKYFITEKSRFGEFCAILGRVNCPVNPRLANTVDMFEQEFSISLEVENKCYEISFSQTYKLIGKKHYYTVEFNIWRKKWMSINSIVETSDFIHILLTTPKNKILWNV